MLTFKNWQQDYYTHLYSYTWVTSTYICSATVAQNNLVDYGFDDKFGREKGESCF